MSGSRTTAAVSAGLAKKNADLLKVSAVLQARAPSMVFVPPLAAVLSVCRSAILLCQPSRRPRADLAARVAAHARAILPAVEMAAASLAVDPSAPSRSGSLAASHGEHHCLIRSMLRIGTASLDLVRSPWCPRVWAEQDGASDPATPRRISAGAELLGAVATLQQHGGERAGDLWTFAVFEAGAFDAVRESCARLARPGPADAADGAAAAAADASLRAVLALLASRPPLAAEVEAAADVIATVGALAGPGLVAPGALSRACAVGRGRLGAARARLAAKGPGAVLAPSAIPRDPAAAVALLGRALDAWEGAGRPVPHDVLPGWPAHVFIVGNASAAVLADDEAAAAAATLSLGGGALRRGAAGVVAPALLALAAGGSAGACLRYRGGLGRVSLLDAMLSVVASVLVSGECPASLWREASPVVWTRDTRTLAHMPSPLPASVASQLRAMAGADAVRRVAATALRVDTPLLSDEHLRRGEEDNIGADEDAGAAAASASAAGGGSGSSGQQGGFSGFMKGLWESSRLAASVFGRRRAPAAAGAPSPPDAAASAASSSAREPAGPSASPGVSAAWGGVTAFSASAVVAMCRFVAAVAAGESFALPAREGAAAADLTASRRVRRELDARRPLLDRRPALNALAFDPALRGSRLLTYFLLDALDGPAFVASLAYQSRARPDGPFAVLYVAAAALQRHVIVLDDLELHDATAPQPAPKRQLRAVVRLATDVLAHAFAAPRGWWPGSEAAAAADAAPAPFWPELREELSGLLAELHSRHTRRTIGPDSVWTVQVGGNAELAAGLLGVAPFSVPFEDRASMFRRRCEGALAGRAAEPPVLVSVSRPALFPSAMAALARVPHGHLHRRLSVEFVDEFGMPEPGIDAGGLTKELFVEVAKLAFDPSYGLFRASDQAELYPNPRSDLTVGDDVPVFRFLGRLLGKALLEGVTVGPQFAAFFLAKLLGKPTHPHYLSTLDKALYANLMFVRSYDGDVENDLCLTMVLPRDDEDAAVGPAGDEIPLVPGGADVPVTQRNRLQYVNLVSDARLNRSIARQTAAFRAGLNEAVPSGWLEPFSEPELQVLVSGTAAGIDVADLKAHTQYAGGWAWGDRTIGAFWEVVETMDAEALAALLRFVTACERPPPLGFRDLRPAFTVQRVPESGNLPTASTCFNVLKLPAYRSKAELERKLRMSIFSGSGFGLS